MKTILVAVLLSACCSASIAEPFFKGYPAGPTYSGPHALPDLRSKDAHTFKSRIRDAARRPANFSGEYSVQTWGCGTGCEQGVVVNIRTGSVTLLPSIEWDSEDVSDDDHFSFKLNSKLLAAIGRMGDDRGRWEYLYRMDPTGLTFLSKSQIRAENVSPEKAALASDPAVSDGSIYADFLCVYYPDSKVLSNNLKPCSPYSRMTYSSLSSCNDFLAEMRKRPGSNSFEGDHVADNGVHYRNELKCLRHTPDWTEAN